MGICIKQIVGFVSHDYLVKIQHGEQQLQARLANVSKEGLENFIKSGEDILVEMEYNSILSSRILENYDDERDAVIMAKENHHLIRGKVCQLLPIENDVMVDLYIRTGPEFICTLLSEYNGLNLAVDQGIEIELTGLTFIV
jgi:hypothetical protein